MKLFILCTFFVQAILCAELNFTLITQTLSYVYYHRKSISKQAQKRGRLGLVVFSTIFEAAK